MEYHYIIAGGGSNGDGAGPQNGLLGTLISLLVAEKSGFSPADGEGMATIKEFAERMAVEAMQQVQQAAMSPEVASAAIGAGSAKK